MFHLKAYLCHTEPFRKRSDGSPVYTVLLDNNKAAHVCLCINCLFLGSEGLGVDKHMSPGTLYGAVVSAALAASIFPVSILQAIDWA